MLNKKLTMKDIESVDPEYYNSLVRDNSKDRSGSLKRFTLNALMMSNLENIFLSAIAKRSSLFHDH